MQTTEILEVLQKAIFLFIKISAPVLLAAMIIGFLISFLQALVQIQEQTLSFVPKMIGILLVLLFSGYLIISNLEEFSNSLFDKISNIHNE